MRAFETLHLVVPGLLGPWRGPLPQVVTSAGLTATEHLLAKAVVSPNVAAFDALLLALFGVPIGTDLPIAPLTRLADTGLSDRDWWMRADPVHLVAGLRDVVLLDARAVKPRLEEARSLAATFNTAFADRQLELTCPQPDRWYLRLPKPVALSTHSLDEAVHQDVQNLLPSGPDSQRWHALLTEMQMLFHGLDLNQSRELRGEFSINSLWLWGAGNMPESIVAPFDAVYAVDPLARGLALRADTRVEPVPGGGIKGLLRQGGVSGEILVVLEDLRRFVIDDEADGWALAARRLDQEWLAPALQMIARGQLGAVVLYPCSGSDYRAARSQLRRFWRRRRALAAYV